MKQVKEIRTFHYQDNEYLKVEYLLNSKLFTEEIKIIDVLIGCKHDIEPCKTELQFDFKLIGGDSIYWSSIDISYLELLVAESKELEDKLKLLCI